MVSQASTLHTYPLNGPQFIDPGWFHQVRQGQHNATVDADRRLVVAGVALNFKHDAPPTGTVVKVWLNASGFFVCATETELQRREAERIVAEEDEKRRERERLNRLRDEDQAFNARIRVPVRWEVGIKDVLSGLSESSWGDGRSKATVEHIYLQEVLETGRLRRDAGDFLCTAAGGTNGKRWSSVVSRAYDGDGQEYQPAVTCKKCLALARRWLSDTTAATTGGSE